MSNIEKSKIQEIVTLHNEIAGHLKMSLEKAIRIGDLLTEHKESLGHGQFTPWIKANLPFTERTAQNYMRIHRERDRLKNESVSYLGEAYKLLEAPKLELEGTELTETKKYDKALESFKVELEELHTLEGQTYQITDDPSVDIQVKTEALQHLSDKAGDKLNEIAEVRVRMQREAGRLLGEIGKRTGNIEDQIWNYLSTDTYKATPVGLIKLKEPTKDDWLEFAEKLRDVDEVIKSFTKFR